MHLLQHRWKEIGACPQISLTPGDIPVEQPTKVELVVNLTTAKALGVTIPPAIMVRADRVIQ
jgi:putative ABC transport system substrate-binding protein